MQIGHVLEQARRRARLEIADVAERTKIRAAYLRALEDEEWEALPSPAYAKGFLRTYAGLLGLDAEALVDEFRRQVETGREGAYPLGERARERPRPPGADSPGIWIAVAAVVAIVAGVLALIGLTGNGDERRGQDRGGRERGAADGERDRSKDVGDAEPFTLALAVEEPVEVCLLDEAERELVDGQVLPAGSQESFTAQGFELRFPRGYGRASIDLVVDGQPRQLPRLDGPAAFELRSAKRLKRAPAPGLGCP